MSQPAIKIENIGKKYRIGAKNARSTDSVRECFRWFSPRARRARDERTEFWALKDVSFDVEEGQVVGIIGRNGAGKSTLLKVLSQITPPTEGRITVRGRIASLLEVGTGFHPELTGRENIYLNGAILGMTRKQISSKFDEIVSFAEVERFLDTPVKRYSSGMYVRLAFAVAAHLEPEILVVDEVLSVGDAEFQAKCLGKMGEVARGGRTVIFVSHNMTAVSHLCERGIVLAGGRVDFMGTAQEAVMHYTPSSTHGDGYVELCDDRSSYEEQVAQFRGARLLGSDGGSRNVFFIGDAMTLQIDVLFHRPVDLARLSFVIRTGSGLNVYHCVMQDSGFEARNLVGPVSFYATFPRLALYPGTYYVDDLWLATPTRTLDNISGDVLSFSVAEGGKGVCRRLASNMAVVHEVPKWTLARLIHEHQQASADKQSEATADA
ncbi:MAG: ABC transporter ATP-binding protein [Armatimonadetes bacterium]|nr:ABC transporter ATP-binding protein [Armatimonadota bacterium]